jgi:hypothetical protein
MVRSKFRAQGDESHTESLSELAGGLQSFGYWSDRRLKCWHSARNSSTPYWYTCSRIFSLRKSLFMKRILLSWDFPHDVQPAAWLENDLHVLSWQTLNVLHPELITKHITHSMRPKLKT